MILTYLKNKKLIGFEEGKNLNKKKINIFFQEKIEKEGIKKILNLKKNKIIYYSNEFNFKILNLIDKTKKVVIKTPEMSLTDFEIYHSSYIFGLFSNTIFTWKRDNYNNWKNFAKISLKDALEKIFILERSNLMITTSFFHNKIKLWSFLNEKILFCGQAFLKEKIASIATGKKQDYFAVGSLGGKVYLYNHNGMLLNVKKPSKFYKKNLGLSKSFPLQFVGKNTLFCGGGGQQLSKWDLRLDKTVSYWNGHTSEIEYIVSPPKSHNLNSFYLLTADTKGVIKKWDIRMERELFSFKFPSNQISSLVIN
mmetsp:Transcript_6416/g.15495  ORF Transcript_6416/g.15495 Transcript_6416/m.15495 type:complete len:309 (+) Transcript_6416:307-1233(+)